jgi:hypothetical protein
MFLDRIVRPFEILAQYLLVTRHDGHDGHDGRDGDDGDGDRDDH